jgi:broad specificity phosphatase PhoE
MRTMLPFLGVLLLAGKVSSVEGLPAVTGDTVRLYLVRHGQAYTNLTPPPKMAPEAMDHLTDLGRQQSRRVASAVSDHGVALVLSSPAGRARDTAAELAGLPGAVQRLEPRLRPLDLGRSSEGTPLTFDARMLEWKAGRDPVPPGGESLAQLGARVYAVLEDLHKDHLGHAVVLVAHGEVIGALLGQIAGTPPAQWLPRDLANGSISVVEWGQQPKPQVVLTNFVPPEAATTAP